jgi:pimeloyl-ACP methyl ester carboxylesterase
LPDTELVVLEGAGHFVYDDAPERTTAAIVDFLARRFRGSVPQDARRLD